MLLIGMCFCHQVYQHRRSLLKRYPFCLQIHHHQCPFRMLKLGHQVRHPCLLRWHRRRHHRHPRFQVQEFLGHRRPRSLAVLLVLPVLALLHQVLQLLDLESLVLHLRLSQAQEFHYRVLPFDCIGAGQLNVKYALVSRMLQSMIDAFKNSKILTVNSWNLESFGACVSCIVWLFQTIWMSKLMFLVYNLGMFEWINFLCVMEIGVLVSLHVVIAWNAVWFFRWMPYMSLKDEILLIVNKKALMTVEFDATL